MIGVTVGKVVPSLKACITPLCAFVGDVALSVSATLVDITHDTKVFSITYKDSVNLDYNAENKTIHRNYNGWIRNLEKGIRAPVSVL